MEMPDVAGFTLGKASKLLSEAGFTSQTINITSSPRKASDKIDDSARVLRIKKLDDTSVELIVCAGINSSAPLK